MYNKTKLLEEIERYFKKGMTSVYMKHSSSEVDFYKWLPTNEFVYRKHDFFEIGSFRLWQTASDILLEEIVTEIQKEIDKEIINEIFKIK